jgi:glutamate-5-semialdehyde dehydrogenase
MTEVSLQSPSDQALINACTDVARRARTAACELATTRSGRKDEWLACVADTLLTRADELLAANARDLAAAPDHGLSPAAQDRLELTPERLRASANGVRAIAALPDPIGQVRSSSVRPNGLEVLKVGVPLGVIFFIYESRPNVTVDAACLCVKSGNAVILRGGKEAVHSNQALTGILQDCLDRVGLPRTAVQTTPSQDRAAVGIMLGLPQFIDLAIPRGGESLIRRVAAEARMPVLKHYKGNCHIFVDRSAELEMAERIILDAKCQRPGTCNAAESLLVHTEIADGFVPRLAAALAAQRVEIRGCPRSRALAASVVPATDEDFAAEYLDLIISLKIVDSLDDALEHIQRFGSQHSEAIITQDWAAARRFTAAVDASAVLVNASTRLNDGYELGLGAEIGISTDKLHARGPCGLLELTTYKYVILGDGQVRGT